MTTVRHICVGFFVGCCLFFLFKSVFYSIGFFVGSWLIDIDHLWQYWQSTGLNFKNLFAPREFFRFISLKTSEFKKRPFLHLLPLHSLEFLCLLYFLAQISGSLIRNLLLGSLLGCVVHLFLDDISLYKMTGVKFTKRVHSIVEFFTRRSFFGNQ